jgi:hypothetical protein
VPPAAAPATYADAAVQGAAANQMARAAAAAGGGQGGTNKTGPQGVTKPVVTAKPDLMGA